MNEYSNFSFDIETDEEDNYTHIGNEFLDCVGLSANKKMIFIMLRRFAGRRKKLDGDGGTPGKLAYPSLKTLEATCGISNNTVIKGIKFYQWLFWLEKIQDKSKAKEWKPNKYILHLKNMRKVLILFEQKKISFIEVENYYDTLYKKNKKLLFEKGCIFLSDTYTSELVAKTLKPYEDPPKKYK